MLSIEHLTKVFAQDGDGMAGGIRDASISVKEGEFLSLLGPSGCGKTTTLRCVAGLETPDQGVIAVGGATLFDDRKAVTVPLNRRDIGMVFQSYAIWPHMNVFENVAFPLRVARRYGREEIGRRVSDALARVDLAGYETRPATRLSGGQQQRVALARAIVREPKLLLLDEPLSNLDAALREEMRKELKGLQRELGLTTVYVTHDQEDALALSDVIAVVNSGHIVQIGSPRDIYFRPVAPFVARFVGGTNLLAGKVVDASVQGKSSRVALEDGQILEGIAAGALAVGEAALISIRPESLRLGKSQNTFKGTIESASFQGAVTRCEIRCGGVQLQVRIDRAEPLTVGASVSVGADADEIIVYPSASSTI